MKWNRRRPRGPDLLFLTRSSGAISKANSFVGQNAWGLRRVPYDNYLTYLHGESVF